MTPACLNQDHAPFEEGEQDRSGRLPPFSPMTPAFLFPCSVIFNSSPDQRETGHQQQLERGSIDVVLASTINNNNNSSSNNYYYYDKSSNTIGQLSNDGYYREDVHGSVQCMSSKMRLMRKTMKSDGIVTSKAAKRKQVGESKQQEQCINDRSNNSSPNAADIRMCFDCNTTKTPLWRSGPAGPKSLCNACGIRQRKARRAMEAAAAVSGGLLPTDRPAGKVLKEKISVGSWPLPCKRPYEIINAGTSKKKLPIDDIMQGLNQKSAFHKVFAQDERDAAILLMALSCGHIHG